MRKNLYLSIVLFITLVLGTEGVLSANIVKPIDEPKPLNTNFDKPPAIIKKRKPIVNSSKIIGEDNHKPKTTKPTSIGIVLPKNSGTGKGTKLKIKPGLPPKPQPKTTGTVFPKITPSGNVHPPKATGSQSRPFQPLPSVLPPKNSASVVMPTPSTMSSTGAPFIPIPPMPSPVNPSKPTASSSIQQLEPEKEPFPYSEKASVLNCLVNYHRFYSVMSRITASFFFNYTGMVKSQHLLKTLVRSCNGFTDLLIANSKQCRTQVLKYRSLTQFIGMELIWFQFKLIREQLNSSEKVLFEVKKECEKEVKKEVVKKEEVKTKEETKKEEVKKAVVKKIAPTKKE